MPLPLHAQLIQMGTAGWITNILYAAAELGLAEASDDELLDAMAENPILIERPFVVTPKGTALARPSERVLDLLEQAPASFTKEDGEVVRTG